LVSRTNGILQDNLKNFEIGTIKKFVPQVSSFYLLFGCPKMFAAQFMSLQRVWVRVRGIRISKGDAISPAGNLLPSPNFGICGNTLLRRKSGPYSSEESVSNFVLLFDSCY
jgi:hypothetical protein